MCGLVRIFSDVCGRSTRKSFFADFAFGSRDKVVRVTTWRFYNSCSIFRPEIHSLPLACPTNCLFSATLGRCGNCCVQCTLAGLQAAGGRCGINLMPSREFDELLYSELDRLEKLGLDLSPENSHACNSHAAFATAAGSSGLSEFPFLPGWSAGFAHSCQTLKPPQSSVKAQSNFRGREFFVAYFQRRK